MTETNPAHVSPAQLAPTRLALIRGRRLALVHTSSEVTFLPVRDHLPVIDDDHPAVLAARRLSAQHERYELHRRHTRRDLITAVTALPTAALAIMVFGTVSGVLLSTDWGFLPWFALLISPIIAVVYGARALRRLLRSTTRGRRQYLLGVIDLPITQFDSAGSDSAGSENTDADSTGAVHDDHQPGMYPTAPPVTHQLGRHNGHDNTAAGAHRPARPGSGALGQHHPAHPEHTPNTEFITAINQALRENQPISHGVDVAALLRLLTDWARFLEHNQDTWSLERHPAQRRYRELYTATLTQWYANRDTQRELRAQAARELAQRHTIDTSALDAHLAETDGMALYEDYLDAQRRGSGVLGPVSGVAGPGGEAVFDPVTHDPVPEIIAGSHTLDMLFPHGHDRGDTDTDTPSTPNTTDTTDTTDTERPTHP